MNVDGKGQLVTKASFLHNTKVVISKINEDKACKKKRDNSHVQGIAISEIEMCRVILKYPEVITGPNYISKFNVASRTSCSYRL